MPVEDLGYDLEGPSGFAQQHIESLKVVLLVCKRTLPESWRPLSCSFEVRGTNPSLWIRSVAHVEDGSDDDEGSGDS